MSDMTRLYTAVGDLRQQVNKNQSLETLGAPALSGAGLITSFLLGLPALRGLWLAGNENDVGTIFDLTGQGRSLTVGAGTPTVNLFGVNSLIPAKQHAGASYYTRASETAMQYSPYSSAIPGLTAGGWFYSTAWKAGDNGLIGKYNTTGNQRAYLLWVNGTGPTARAIVSSNGTLQTETDHTTPLTANAWHFIVMRYTPSTSLDVIVDGVKVSNTTSIPNPIFQTSTADFEIASYNGGGNDSVVNWAAAFLTMSAVPDAMLDFIFQNTRGMFGA